jgi:SAM-dependent methyltransferase
MGRYDRAFFRRLDSPAVESARVVVPLLLELIQPKSVVDIGCGTGGWLSVFHEHGIEDVIGVDGDYIDRHQLRIAPEHFIAADLRRPLALQRLFDLVVCLEVAEHLPATVADSLVGMLTDLGPVILFSAAIPFQGGTAHVNEQWPDYWQARFITKGFTLVDCIRGKVWSNQAVEPYIAQNLLLYVQNDRLVSSETLRTELARVQGLPLRLVHPGIYLSFNLRRPIGLLRRRLITRE